MAIEIKAAQGKSWLFYISNGEHNIAVNIGRELNYALSQFMKYGLEFIFEGEPIKSRGIITHSCWEGEISPLNALPIPIANAAIVMFKTSMGEIKVISRYGAIPKEASKITVKDALRLHPSHYVLLLYPDSFTVWDNNCITGLAITNPDMLIQDLL